MTVHDAIIRRCILVGLAGAVLIVGCGSDPVQVPTSPFRSVPTLTASSPRVDVPAVTIDLPPAPRSWDTSDVALIEAVQAAGGVVAIAFKEASSSRALENGQRAAVTSGTITAALGDLESIGIIEVMSELRAFGAIQARIDPEAAPAVSRHPLVDFVEPDMISPVQAIRSGVSLADLRDIGATALAHAATSVGDTLNWGIEMIRADEAWVYGTGSPTVLMIISTGHERGHPDLPLVPLGNCGGPYGGCDDGDGYALYPGTNRLGHVAARLNALGWVGAAPGLDEEDIYSWGACLVNQPTGYSCSALSVAQGLDEHGLLALTWWRLTGIRQTTTACWPPRWRMHGALATL